MRVFEGLRRLRFELEVRSLGDCALHKLVGIPPSLNKRIE